MGEGQNGVAEGGKEGVQDDGDGAGAVFIGKEGGDENRKEGAEVRRGGEELGCERGVPGSCGGEDGWQKDGEGGVREVGEEEDEGC